MNHWLVRHVLFLLVAVPLALAPLSAAHAQSRASLGSRFHAVAITRNTKPLLAPAYYNDTDGALVVQGPSLAAVIAKAYGLEAYQIVDGPEWIYAVHLYDIHATPPPARFAEASETGMLQGMLADRFKLEVRSAQREVITEALVLAPGKTPEGVTFDSGDRRVASIDFLASNLSNFFGRPVTNLTGMRTIRIVRNTPLPASLTLYGSDVTSEGVKQALLESYGLVLEPKGTVLEDVLIITMVEHPELED